MTPNSGITFNAFRQNPALAELMRSLERGFRKFGIDYYLVGAMARDYWMQALDGPPRRATTDIDFGIYIKRIEEFEKLKAYLVEEGFSAYKENPFVLIWKDGREVDLMPFREVAYEGKVKVQGSGMTTLHVDGFQEVYEEGLPEVTIGSQHS
jgi:predicted nucleotidyltransferase